jgi:hypothetical protein
VDCEECRIFSITSIVRSKQTEMGNFSDQGLFERAGWRMRVLIPAWVVQVASLLGMMGLFSYRLAETIEAWEDKTRENNGSSSIPMVELV